MGQIVVLDQNMINMIAAGEVIERPASVVKELIENSIDAGATKITVLVEDGGRKLISVADNGSGMDAEDLAAGFESHTTSKIKTSSDLRAISTLGFRGEALASIASVAQVRAVSRTKDSLAGNCVEIDCGNKGDLSPCSTDCGTTIEVRDIFYKLPARRKFLRTANTEMGHITERFTRVALANCNLDMTLMHNNRELYQLLGEQSLRQRIAKLFPSDISESLIEAQSDERELHIFALMGTPGTSRTNSKFQYVFLNGRFIRDKFISHAIKEAYRGSMEPNRFPVIFLFIEMPYEEYDVNVHPTKVEVRFYNANLLHSQVLGCLREKLLSTKVGTHGKLPSSLPSNQGIQDAMAEFFKKHQPIATQQQISFSTATSKRPLAKSGDHRLDTVRASYLQSGGKADTSQLREHFPRPTLETKFMQIHDSFIVVSTDDGFIIVDQHALHERILYENLSRRLQTEKLQSQKLLIPESFELTDAATNAVNTNAELIEKLGIELVPFGPKTMAIQGFPTLLANAAPLDFVRDLIDLLVDKGKALDAQTLLDEVLSMAACKAAIKAGQKLTDSEIVQLLADRENTAGVTCCPHGRPTTIKFTKAELEKQFKRT